MPSRRDGLPRVWFGGKGNDREIIVSVTLKKHRYRSKRLVQGEIGFVQKAGNLFLLMIREVRFSCLRLNCYLSTVG